jgi:RNA-directed DNA polymerase
VADAYLSGYFDGIPHAQLMKSESRRISDYHILRLLKIWLETPVEETDAKGIIIGRLGKRTKKSEHRKVLRSPHYYLISTFYHL